jgi:hypothetical protein
MGSELRENEKAKLHIASPGDKRGQTKHRGKYIPKHQETNSKEMI